MATIEELTADRAALAAARATFLSGGQVKVVQRDGRRMEMATTSLADFDTALARLDSEIAGLTSTTGRRRRALSVSF